MSEQLAAKANANVKDMGSNHCTVYWMDIIKKNIIFDTKVTKGGTKR